MRGRERHAHSCSRRPATNERPLSTAAATCGGLRVIIRRVTADAIDRRAACDGDLLEEELDACRAGWSWHFQTDISDQVRGVRLGIEGLSPHSGRKIVPRNRRDEEVR